MKRIARALTGVAVGIFWSNALLAAPPVFRCNEDGRTIFTSTPSSANCLPIKLNVSEPNPLDVSRAQTARMEAERREQEQAEAEERARLIRAQQEEALANARAAEAQRELAREQARQEFANRQQQEDRYVYPIGGYYGPVVSGGYPNGYAIHGVPVLTPQVVPTQIIPPAPPRPPAMAPAEAAVVGVGRARRGR